MSIKSYKSTVEFRFQSSNEVEAVEIYPRDSISIGELKSMIIRQKKIDQSRGYNLVLFDPITRQEYKDESIQVHIGSSVIVKRVPVGIVPSPIMKRVNLDDNLKNQDPEPDHLLGSMPLPLEENFEDFGDGYDISNTSIVASLLDEEKPFNASTRNGTQIVDANCVSLSSSKGSNHLVAGKEFQVPMESKGGEDPKQEKKKRSAYLRALRSVVLPSELKCPLCNAYLKKAVMIRCCQHSFCENCIIKELNEKAKCPKCNSSKCKVSDLFPNVSLRGAIKRFLSDEGVPDAESGNQGKDYSCAMTIDKGAKMPAFPASTEEGFNQIIGENEVGDDVFMGGSRSHEGLAYPNLMVFKGLGEHDGYLWDQGDHSCFKFGSPDHFINDYPVAPNFATMPPAGNFTSGAPLSSYWSMYGYYGMTHSNFAMFPNPPYVVNPFVPFGQPVSSGVMMARDMGFSPQYRASSGHPILPSEPVELQSSENLFRITNNSRGSLKFGSYEKLHGERNSFNTVYVACLMLQPPTCRRFWTYYGDQINELVMGTVAFICWRLLVS